MYEVDDSAAITGRTYGGCPSISSSQMYNLQLLADWYENKHIHLIKMCENKKYNKVLQQQTHHIGWAFPISPSRVFTWIGYEHSHDFVATTHR